MPPKVSKATAERTSSKKRSGAAATGGAGFPTGSLSMHALYRQFYNEMAAKYGPKTAIFMQVGGFYELYDTMVVATGVWNTNAPKIAELCILVPAPNTSVDPAVECYCWGFPLNSIEKYKSLMLDKGYTAVIVEQEKDGIGDIKRRITEIASPGLFTGTTPVRREEQTLLSVYVEPYAVHGRRGIHWYVASSAFDVNTGKLVSMETDLTLIDGKPVLDVVTPFWSLYPPAEVCFYWCGGADTTPPTQQQVMAMFAGAASLGRPPSLHIYTLDPTKENNTGAERIRSAALQEWFHHEAAISVEESLGITRYPFTRRSLCHLLTFVKDHNPSYLRLLHDHTMWTPDENVLLGNAALEQLGMLPLSQDREHESLLWWLQKAQTAMGRRTLRERMLKPIADVEELEGRQMRIADLRVGSGAERGNLETMLRGMYDLSRLHRRFQLANAGTDDLLQLMSSYQKVGTLIRATNGKLLEAQDHELFHEHIQKLLSAFDEERIRKAKAQSSDPIALGSVHPWVRGIHTELDECEDRWLALERTMMTLKQKLEDSIEDEDCVNWTLREDMPFCFLVTQRRGTLLISASAKREHGVEHLTTIKHGSKGQMMLQCAEIDSANMTARTLREDWKTAVKVAWDREWDTWTCAAIESGVLEALCEWIGLVDCECTLARLSDQYNYVRPTYKESDDVSVAGLNVQGLRHPIIERVHTSVPYISHNVCLGAFAKSVGGAGGAGTGAGAEEEEKENASAKNGILLYGVNAAGKSSLGKAIGLAVLLAQTGCPVPATSMTLIPYTGLFTRILGNDNLWAGMSSFVVEMTEFRSILRSAAQRTLVLGDELCAGTETASATSIVAAGVKTLVDRGAHFFLATHLHELTDIPAIAKNPALGFYHLSVRPSTTHHGALLYDRKIRKGTGSPMYGLEVCRGLDMDSTFLTTAFDFRRAYFAEDGSRLSAYNADVVVAECQVCGKRRGGTATAVAATAATFGVLETHHIVPQASAAAGTGKLPDGRHKNEASNLVPLCSTCHDAHHRGLLEIKGWVESSFGRKLEFAWK